MTTTPNAAILTRWEDSVGWITLSRPGSINAINDAIRAGLPRALEQMDQDDAIRVIVVNGSGTRGFCAGADIKEIKPAEAAIESGGQAHAAWIETFDQVKKPLIASIHGYCVGGGLEIALACDLRIASSDAIFAFPETGLGLIPGGGGTQRLPRVVGLGRALDMLLTGDRVDAATAMSYGLITRLVRDPAALPAETQAIAKRIAAQPVAASRRVKEAARAAFEADLKSGLRFERDLFCLLQSPEQRKAAALSLRAQKSRVDSD